MDSAFKQMEDRRFKHLTEYIFFRNVHKYIILFFIEFIYALEI